MCKELYEIQQAETLTSSRLRSQSMQNLIEQVSLLPRNSLTSEESERINMYLQAFRTDLTRKQALINIGLSSIASDAQGMTSEEWLSAMKEPLQFQAAGKQEMDELANALGSW
jgi:hypothetical protein